MRVEIVKINGEWILRFINGENHVMWAKNHSRLIFALETAASLAVHVDNRSELPI